MPQLIADPAAINPAWLTSVLQHAGIDATVTDCTSASIGTGQVGENVRFTLQGSGDLPTSVVGKFASLDPQSKATGVQLQNYTKEVFFYRDLQSTVDIRTPRIFFADIDPATHDFVILMEDLAPGEQGDQLTGCSVDDAALALTELAKLHGPRWADATLDDYPLLSRRGAGDAAAQAQSLYGMLQPGFLQRYAARLDAKQLAMVAGVGGVQASYGQYDGDVTLIHIDYRLDNMMFGGPYPLAVVDWQSISLGCALIDVSYFMGTSLDPAVRAANETALVREYLDVLNGYGVGLDWDNCWRLYRHYAPAGLNMAVIASMIVGETERGNDMFMAMATRSIQMCEDLDTIKLLQG